VWCGVAGCAGCDTTHTRVTDRGGSLGTIDRVCVCVCLCVCAAFARRKCAQLLLFHFAANRAPPGRMVAAADTCCGRPAALAARPATMALPAALHCWGSSHWGRVRVCVCVCGGGGGGWVHLIDGRVVARVMRVVRAFSARLLPAGPALRQSRAAFTCCCCRQSVVIPSEPVNAAAAAAQQGWRRERRSPESSDRAGCLSVIRVVAITCTGVCINSRSAHCCARAGCRRGARVCAALAHPQHASKLPVALLTRAQPARAGWASGCLRGPSWGCDRCGAPRTHSGCTRLLLAVCVCARYAGGVS
jgi:hypothetical protein